MAADLYSAGLLVQHGLSASVVVQDVAKVKAVKVIPSPPLKKETINPLTVPQELTSKDQDQSQNDHHHHHHHAEISIQLAKEIGTDYDFKRKIVWFNAIGFLVLHLCGVYGVYLMFSGHAKIWTTIYCKIHEGRKASWSLSEKALDLIVPQLSG